MRSKEISKRDIVSQVVYTQMLDMGLAAPLCYQLLSKTRDALQLNAPYKQLLLATWSLEETNQ